MRVSFFSPISGVIPNLKIKPVHAAFGPSFPVANRTSLRGLDEILDSLVAGMRKLDRSARTVSSTSTSGIPDLFSAGPLGLSYTPSAASLTSFEEVNMIPTSYGPREPDFAGASTSNVMITGTYDGSLGDDTLTFEVSKNATIGSGNFKLDVYDGSGSKVDSLNFNQGQGSSITTNFGLTVSLSAGNVVKDDTFTVGVSASQGTTAEPDNPFDGIGDLDPLFDPGQSVVAGSFEINGNTIAVAADDTINSVLSKINASGAGVTAVFDAATDSVRITHDTLGSAGQIVFTGDTSGFLDATKLSTASVVPGVDADHLAPIAGVAGLAGIQDGSFSVNGHSVSIDTSVDSLQDVLDRIEAVAPGVSASVDTTTDRVHISSAGSLSIFDGTSNFFSAVQIQEGVYAGDVSSTTSKVVLDEDQVYAGLKEFGDALKELFDAEFHPFAAGLGAQAIQAVRTAVSGAMEGLASDPEADLVRSGLGLDFDFREPQRGVLRVNSGRLGTAFKQRGDEIQAFLSDRKAEDGHSGLVERLEDGLRAVRKALGKRLAEEGGGSLLNVLA